MKSWLSYIIIILVLCGCKKEQTRRQLGAYYKFKVDGVQKEMEDGVGLNDNIFTCKLFGDSAIYVDVTKLYEGAGFYIETDHIKDTTYTFSTAAGNAAYYNSPSNERYTTNDTLTGSVTIQRGIFHGASTINTLKGTFSYDAARPSTGQIIHVTEGEFYMELSEQ